jgi:N-acyl-D-amino-acid deacylase
MGELHCHVPFLSTAIPPSIRFRPDAARVLALVLAIAATQAHAQPVARYDVVIRHGTVIDGTGSPPYRGDVAVIDGAIARVGDLADARGAVEIDAAGLTVTPGFINIHSHATPEGLAVAANMLTQGVTTEIVNADGSGPLDLGAQLADLTARGLAVNVGANIGFNSVWTEVVGQDDRRPTADEIARMQRLITTGLERGAWGVSAGLDYKPAYFAQTEEVIRVVEAARSWRTLFTNHDRLTPEAGFSSQVAMAETLAIGARTGLAPVITHMKAQGREQGTVDVTLKRMREAADRGVHAAADVYPYLAGQTGLVAFTIPGWAQAGGRDAMMKRFADPALRARIVSEAETAMQARFGGPSGVSLPSLNKALTDVMREWQVPAGEAVVRLLEQGSPGIIARFGIEADLVKILQYPATSVSCDCGAVVGQSAHPRYYGTFPRVLGRYVREQQALTLPDAVRKMTGLPAATIGLVDRGLIAVGMAADLVAFDAAQVIDHATFEAPMRPSEGIRYVLVNGRIALSDGAPTGVRAGLALTRGRHMPARPMNGRESRSVVAGFSARGVAAIVEVRQPEGARRAQGTFRLTRPSDNLDLDMTEFGQLQTATGWTSFTGIARLRRSEPERAIAVITDGDDLIVRAGDFTFDSTQRR